MNLVGKIFTVLIFVMCIVFSSFALMLHSAHKIWHEEIVKKGGYRDQVDDAKKDAYNAQRAFAVARAQWDLEKDRWVKERKDLLAKNEHLTEANNAAQATLLRVQGDNRRLVAQVDLTEKNLANVRVETENVRDRARQAEIERQKIWDSLVKATNDVMTAGATVAMLEKRGRVLAEQAQKEHQLAEWTKARPSDMTKEPPTDLTGEVTGIRGSDVEISVGFDDGVHEGQRFSVTRPSTGHYICDVVVFKVPYPNRAVCRADKPTMRDQIQKGDNVKAIVSKRR